MPSGQEPNSPIKPMKEKKETANCTINIEPGDSENSYILSLKKNKLTEKEQQFLISYHFFKY